MEEDPIQAIEKKVQILLVQSDTSITKLCEGIGMTVNGYQKMWKNRSIKVETIQRIAAFFKVPLSHFFSNPATSVYEIGTSDAGVEEMKEKYIQALESENRLLKQLLDQKGKS